MRTDKEDMEILNEYPGEGLATSGSALLAQTLAWAAQNDIPFHEVILSLTKTGYSGFKQILFLSPRSKNWNKCLLASYSDLVNGVPLYETLRKRFSYFLPEYYLQAVEKAEKEKHLAETLPYFSKRLNLSCEIQKKYRYTLAFPILEFSIIFSLLLFLSTFIFPNFNKIFEDLAGSEMNTLFLRSISTSLYIFSRFFWVFFCVIGVIWIWNILIRYINPLRRFLRNMMEELFIFIPPWGNQLKNIALLELSSSLASYLAAGEDILDAAKYSEKACEHFWLKRKLGKFISKVEKGENWLDAWSSMKIKENLSECIIRNAAAKEDIASGFDTLSCWLYQKQIKIVTNNTVWLFVASITLNAIMVFLIMVYVFQLLIQMIYAS